MASPTAALVVLAHVGQDGLALGRRRVEQGQVADAGEAHLQGAGDRRGRQREHVDVGPELLDGLLVRHPEALLLVDHQQAEVLEGDVARQQAVGADDHVHLTTGQPLGHLAGLGVGQEPAEHLDPHRVAGEAVAEGLEVLLGQQGGGHQHRGLAAVLHRLEHGPHRHLGLAEAHVAAHQAVHGDGPLHVGLDLVDGHPLVGGELEGERRFELELPRACRGRRRGRACGPGSGTARPAPGRSRPPPSGPGPWPWTSRRRPCG